MIIKCKIGKNLLGKSKTVISFNKQTVLLEYILLAMNVLLEYFNIDIRNFYIGMVIRKIISILSINQYIMAALVATQNGKDILILFCSFFAVTYIK